MLSGQNSYSGLPNVARKEWSKLLAYKGKRQERACRKEVQIIERRRFFGTYAVVACCCRPSPENFTSTAEIHMIRHIIFVGAMTLAMSAGALAQGIPDGADHGARVGEHDAGPVGAVVGGVVGGVIGGVNGVLGIDDRPRFHSYVVERHYPSYEYRDDLRVGAVLPDAGVVYYDVPPEYSSARGYRYTIVNGHTVLVDPRTHTIIQIVD
jgi:hypothetical protein